MDSQPPAPAPREVTEDLVALLARCPAFVDFDDDALVALVGGASLAYLAAGTEDPHLTAPLVVQRGALLVKDADGRTVDLVSEGEYHWTSEAQTVTAREGSLVVVLPEEAADLAWSHAGVQPAPGPTARDVDLQTAPVRTLMARDLVTAHADETCRAVAERMRAHEVSSVVVLPRDSRGEPGIATDRDLRNRLVAAGGSTDDPVGLIASFPVRTVSGETPVFGALVEMLSSGIHHLPVTDGDRLVGMVTSSDLLQLRLRSPLHLRKVVDRAETVDDCAVALAALPDAVRALRVAGTTPLQTSEVLATIVDRLVVRLLALSEADVGAGAGLAPSTEQPSLAPSTEQGYAWLAFGSQARRESTLSSDQDSGLVLGAGVDEEWAARVGSWVTTALERCGYRRCSGGIMASEPRWRGDVATWQARFARWIATPVEANLLDADIAFDHRVVAGDLDAADLLAPTVATARDHGVFLARLAQQTVRHRPPLGFLGRLAVDRSGEHAGTFDLKRGALLPIVDLARLHTLARGGREVGTAERLRAAVAAGLLSVDLGGTLAAGHELALGVRLDHHLAQHAAGAAIDDRVDPGTLPALVRAQLKETFKAIRTAQEDIEQRYRLVGPT